MPLIVLSGNEAANLLEARDAGRTQAAVSPDLGLTTLQALLEPHGARLPDAPLLQWHRLEEIAAAGQGCFLFQRGDLRKIQVFSELTGRSYVLMPTRGAPTVLNSGIPMHRIKDVDPMADTRQKIRAIAPVA